MTKKLTENEALNVKYVLENPEDETFYNEKKGEFVNSVEQATPYLTPDFLVSDHIRLGGSENDFQQSLQDTWDVLYGKNAVGIIRDDKNNVNTVNEAYKFDKNTHAMYQIDPDQVEITGKPTRESDKKFDQPNNHQLNYNPLPGNGDLGPAAGFAGQPNPIAGEFANFQGQYEPAPQKAEQTSLFDGVDFDDLGKDTGLNK